MPDLGFFLDLVLSWFGIWLWGLETRAGFGPGFGCVRVWLGKFEVWGCGGVDLDVYGLRVDLEVARRLGSR